MNRPYRRKKKHVYMSNIGKYKPCASCCKTRVTNHPIANVYNLILPLALKENQNQFQKPSSVSLAIKSIILTNELQDENTFHFHNASSEQRSQSPFSFRSDTLLLQSCPLKTIRHVLPQQNEDERIRTGKRQKQTRKELMLCRDIP